MNIKKLTIFLCSGFFLLCIASTASAISMTFYDTEADAYYKGPEKFEFEFEGLTNDGGTENSWKFKVEVDKGKTEKNEWERKWKIGKEKFKQKGEFSSFEFVMDLAGGYFTGTFGSDEVWFAAVSIAAEDIEETNSFEAKGEGEGLISNELQVPEPATMVLLGLGLLGLAGITRRKFRK